MSRRVVLGQQNDGTYALRVSAPGFDAMNGTDDGHQITFDSRWTDIAKIHAIGLVSWQQNAFLPTSQSTVASNGFIGFWPNLGYKPFAEVHRLAGGATVRDDYWNSSFTSGCYATIMSDRFTAAEFSATSDQALFIAFKIPVPSQ